MKILGRHATSTDVLAAGLSKRSRSSRWVPCANADVMQPRAVRAMDTFASYIKGHVTRPSGEPTIGFIVDW